MHPNLPRLPGRGCAYLLTAALPLLSQVITAEPARRPLTTADVIELRRPWTDGLSPPEVFLSPDGHRFAAVLLQGELARDGYWVEIVVGSTASLEAAAQLKTVARIFMKAHQLEWEMFSRLKVQGRPVELDIDPDSVHGDHPLQVPSQQLASIQGTVDWMDFWLNGRESADPARQPQYVRWRRLRQLQELSAGFHWDVQVTRWKQHAFKR